MAQVVDRHAADVRADLAGRGVERFNGSGEGVVEVWLFHGSLGVRLRVKGPSRLLIRS